MRKRWQSDTALVWRIGFALPLAGLAVVFACAGTVALSILGALLNVVLLWPAKGRSLVHYLALICALLSWVLCLALLAPVVSQILPVWAAFGIFALGGLAACWAMVRIAVAWGWQHAAARAAAGRPIREWEWVETGPDFARNHRLGQFGGGLWLVLGFVLAQAAGSLWALTLAENGWRTAGAALVLLLSCLSLYALIARRKGARELVWGHFILGAPLSLPLIVYWADGARPNLTYAHRFERLVPLGYGPHESEA